MHRLLEAYRNTTYHCPGYGDIRVGKGAPENFRSTGSWVIVTACNPGSVPLSRAGNRARQQALVRWLQGTGHEFSDSLARADDGGWPDEPGYLVFDPDPELYRVCRERWGQNAVVTGPENNVCSILVLNPDWIRVLRSGSALQNTDWLKTLDSTPDSP